MNRAAALGITFAVAAACALAVTGCAASGPANGAKTGGSASESQSSSSVPARHESTAVVSAIESVAAGRASSESVPGTRVPGESAPVAAQVVSHGPRTRGKVVALTFDLCATPGFPETLDGGIVRELLRTRTPATFMMTGLWAKAHPADAARLASAGLFEIGNHSWEHPHPRALSNSELRADTIRAQQEIYSVTHLVPRVYRFPYEESDARTVGVVSDLGLASIAQDVNPQDPDKHVSASEIASYVPAHVRPGSIVIMHANGRGWHSAAALPLVIARLKANGYRFVTASDLLGLAGR